VGSPEICKGSIYYTFFVEIDELLQQERKVRGKLRNYLLDGKRILLEWSFAVDTDVTGDRIGKSYLVFYECRTV
jgi:hypothetical protein